MTLLDEARKIALQTTAAKATQEEAERTVRAKFQTLVDKLRDEVTNELRSLVGPPGPFQGDFMQVGGPDTFAIIHAGSAKVAWFKATVVSGTQDLSDDCRGIPFTEARVWARVYPPQRNERHDGTWDFAEERYYHNGGMTYRCSSEEDLPRFLKELAEAFAPWCA